MERRYAPPTRGVLSGATTLEGSRVTLSVLASSHASRIINTVQSGLRPAGIEPHVTRSWYRCIKEYGIEPQGPRQVAVLDPLSVKELQQRMGELLRVARAEMESLYEQISGSGFAVILADARGTVLNTITDPTLQREFRQAGLWLGALWDERHEGTNGIGTCVAEAGAVTVHREEHFRGYNMSLSCSGAPILDPHGELMAVLDASTVNSNDSRLIQRHTMALVNMSANLISRWNFLREFGHGYILRFHSRPEFVGLLHEALLAVDASGNVQAVNESALLQLGCANRKQLVGKSISEFFQFDFTTLEQRAYSESGAIWPVRDVALGRRFFAIVRAPVPQPLNASLLRIGASGPGQGGILAQAQVNTRLEPGNQYVGADEAIHKALACGHQLFAKQIPILLQGATGTGKEAFARTLHRESHWHDRPFVTVNCAAIPESLIESELFGYAQGKFANTSREGRAGKIQQSSGGTLFLDEIGDMPMLLQTRLLRVIEAREVAPLGGEAAIPVDLHVITASHRDLRAMVASGEFREDLYYRLNGMTLCLPLLRDRGDKAELIQALLREEAADATIEIARDAFKRLIDYPWPGNVRQLRNVLRTASVLCRNHTIRLSNLPQEILDNDNQAAPAPASFVGAGASGTAQGPAGLPSSALRDAERAALLRELERLRWNVSRTAAALNISRNTLYRKMHKHGIVLSH
ncbi:MAG: sigma-54-dependent Fis family transcriptional regulator [Proteobacteria bacterium]|nr:sigma-54-dependent Fis family transcriptional regulator [Pseudomonadota bacterium]